MEEQEGVSGESKPTFGAELERFIVRARSLSVAFPTVTSALESNAQQKATEFLNLIVSNSTHEFDRETNRLRMHGIPFELMSKVDRSSRDARTAQLSEMVVGKSLVVALISQYDVFIGQLVRLLYAVEPSLLDVSDRHMTFAQLVSYQSIDQAREDILEKEVESVLYKSREEQLDYLSKKGKVELVKHLNCWQNLVEITERRNLFVHADGRVNRTYLNRCNQHGIKPSGGLGEMLNVSIDYFRQSYYSVVEVGLVVAILLWRKLQPSDLETLLGTVTSIVYYLILDEEYEIAQRLIKFVTGPVMGKGIPEQHGLTLLVNQAQALKWSGDDKKMEELLNTKDWSVLNDKFRLAERVLRNDFAQAAKLMRGLVVSQEMNRVEFQEWPLFTGFRKSEEFKEVYLEVFGGNFDSSEEINLADSESLKAIFDKFLKNDTETEAIE